MNQHGHATCFQTLPKIQAFVFSPDLSFGDTAVITCAVKKGSQGPHSLAWLKDSLTLTGSHRVSVARQSDIVSTLTLRDIEPDDVGNYTCVARNARGSQDAFTAVLTVSGTEVTTNSYFMVEYNLFLVSR
ncbi:hypothetical protein HPB48_008458 [Haemaphysalis longicornis]|uniref:Ig-like domain-containing protein n=1 Tax=Haemaphysalis longicornis TaxID=44386 RepID=A0A9J6FPC7_HAELO|nr:hypothetical protein HPB48_008458 [Haemaphysalis longicornis]